MVFCCSLSVQLLVLLQKGKVRIKADLTRHKYEMKCEENCSNVEICILILMKQSNVCLIELVFCCFFKQASVCSKIIR